MYPFLKLYARFFSVFAFINTNLHCVYSAKTKSKLFQY